jgi:sporulation protein YlmC with PRC-barrel domain
MLGVSFMKSTVPIIAVSALTLFLGPVNAAEEPGKAELSAAKEQKPDARVSKDRKASTILGMNVENNAGEDLGTVEDMVLRLAHGRITAVVISTGGFLGIGDELSIVPPQSLKMNLDKKLLQLETN